jgi:hypothetical protein
LRRFAWQSDLPSLSSATVVGIALLIAILIGGTISGSVVGPRELAIVILVMLTAILILVPADRILRLGLVGWILTFGFGWRTIHLTSTINIHPSEVLVWVLFVLITARRIVRREGLDLRIPIFMPVLMVFSSAGLWTAITRVDQIGAAIQESKILFALVPCFYVVKWLIKDRADWDRSVWSATLVAVYVSVLGLMDYLDPSLSALLTGRSAAETVTISVQGFERAGFIFFGSTAAAFVILTFVSFAILYFLESLTGSRLILVVSAMVLSMELAAIYISGYRGVWFAAGVVIGVYALVQRRAWLLLAGVSLGLPLLPSDFFYRLTSLFDLRYADSSQFKRLDRARQALELVFQSPINGVGWGGSGYVHSDIIQLAANLGLPALGVFLLWVLNTAWSLLRLIGRQDWIGQYAKALLAALSGLMVVLAGEGIIVWAQLMLPAWFMFAMCFKLVEFASKEEKIVQASFSPTTFSQLAP